jgi:TRAP-type C4-dicarboxylate transport system permease small subunit
MMDNVAKRSRLEILHQKHYYTGWRAWMERFVRFADWLGYGLAWIGAMCLVLIVALVVAGIVARSLFNVDLPFSWEYSGYLMSGVFFFGAAQTLRSGKHIRVSLLFTPRFARYSRAIEAVATLATLALVVFLTVTMTELAWSAYLRGLLSYTPMQTPLVIPQSIPAFGGIVLIIQLCARFMCVILCLPVELSVEDDSVTADT